MAQLLHENEMDIDAAEAVALEVLAFDSEADHAMWSRVVEILETLRAHPVVD